MDTDKILVSDLYLEKYKDNLNFEKLKYIIRLEAYRSYNNWLYLMLLEDESIANPIMAGDLVDINNKIERFKIENEL